MTIEEQIAAYLANETKLYQDWYQEVNVTEADPAMRQIAKFPSLEELKARSKHWCNKNLPTFKKILCTQQFKGETVCQKWQRMQHKEHLKEILVAITVDIGVGPFFHPSHTAVVLTMLAVSGILDSLCEEC